MYLLTQLEAKTWLIFLKVAFESHETTLRYMLYEQQQLLGLLSLYTPLTYLSVVFCTSAFYDFLNSTKK